jgi:hypothetical protein
MYTIQGIAAVQLYRVGRLRDPSWQLLCLPQCFFHSSGGFHGDTKTTLKRVLIYPSSNLNRLFIKQFWKKKIRFEWPNQIWKLLLLERKRRRKNQELDGWDLIDHEEETQSCRRRVWCDGSVCVIQGTPKHRGGGDLTETIRVWLAPSDDKKRRDLFRSSTTKKNKRASILLWCAAARCCAIHIYRTISIVWGVYL